MSGKAFLLKISRGGSPAKYETLAGLRVKEMSICETATSVVASGIFLASQSESEVSGYALAGALADYELTFEDGEKWRGRFLIQRLDYSGDFNGERNYTLQLESAGKVVIA